MEPIHQLCIVPIIVHGSFNDTVYILPLVRECSVKAMAYSPKSLWWGLLTVFILFCVVILPVVLLIKK